MVLLFIFSGTKSQVKTNYEEKNSIYNFTAIGLLIFSPYLLNWSGIESPSGLHTLFFDKKRSLVTNTRTKDYALISETEKMELSFIVKKYYLKTRPNFRMKFLF